MINRIRGRMLLALPAAVAFLALPVPAATATTARPAATGSLAGPVSSVVWSGGGRSLCLRAPDVEGGATVTLGRCDPDAAGQQWDFTGGLLRPYGSALYVTASPRGALVLTGALGPVWVYGPGHTLSAATPPGPAYLAYCGTGGHPVISAPSCGRVWYVFTHAG